MDIFLPNIYLFKKNNIKQFQVSTIEESLCKVHIMLCICNSNPKIGAINNFSQVGSSIFNVSNEYQ
jgi:hypothetical protein